MDELVFDEARSAVVGSTLRAFAADGRPTAEVERLLVHVARTASVQDLVDVAYDLAAQVLSPAAWDALCEEPWMAAELDAAAAADAPVEVRLVVTGATPEQVRRLLDHPVEVLGEALGVVGDPGEGAEVPDPAVGQALGLVGDPWQGPEVPDPAVGQPDAGDAEPDPGEFDGARVGDDGVGPDDVHGNLGVPLSRAVRRRTRRRGGPARSRAPRPCGPRDATRSRPTAPGRADAGPRAARRGTAGVAPWCPRLPRGRGTAGARSRDGPDVGPAHRGGARTVTM